MSTMSSIVMASTTASTSEPLPTLQTMVSSITTPTIATVTVNQPDASQTFPPLTTHWSTPLSCTWTYASDVSHASQPTGAVAWLDLDPIPGASTLSCYPDGMFEEGRTGIFSPATCPNGWTTVYATQNTEDARATRTTTAVCCSSGYSLNNEWCVRSVPTAVAVPAFYTDNSSLIVNEATTTTLYSASLAVHTIQALFCEKDKSMLGLTDAGELSGSNETKKQPGLTTAERIGIAVSVAVICISVIGITVLCLLRRRRKKEDANIGFDTVIPRFGAETRAAGGEMAEYRYRSDLSARSGSRTHSRTQSNRTSSLHYHHHHDTIADASRSSDGEMQELQAQKAAIERRMEELEIGEDGHPMRT